MLIIPAIDILDGKVVRLAKGDYDKVTVYNEDPVAQAQRFADSGMKRIHVVDLGGSRDDAVGTLATIREIKKATALEIEFGGGIRGVDSAQLLLDAGVDYLVVGSLAVKNKPEFESLVAKAGAEKIIAAADVVDGQVKVKGWTEDAGVTLDQHIEYCTALGVDTFLCTDIERDGMLTGPAIDMYLDLQQRYSGIKLIASGGISGMEDVWSLMHHGLWAAVLGRALYEEKITLKELASIGN